MPPFPCRSECRSSWPASSRCPRPSGCVRGRLRWHRRWRCSIAADDGEGAGAVVVVFPVPSSSPVSSGEAAPWPSATGASVTGVPRWMPSSPSTSRSGSRKVSRNAAGTPAPRSTQQPTRSEAIFSGTGLPSTGRVDDVGVRRLDHQKPTSSAAGSTSSVPFESRFGFLAVDAGLGDRRQAASRTPATPATATGRPRRPGAHAAR